MAVVRLRSVHHDRQIDLYIMLGYVDGVDT